MRSPATLFAILAATLGALACTQVTTDPVEAPGPAAAPDASPPPPPQPPLPPEPLYTYYWVLGQDPSATNMFLYSKTGATVTFGGTIATPTDIELTADTFSEYNVGSLGYAQEGTEWFFLELTATDDLMVSFDRAVEVQVGEDSFETRHGDSLLNMPARELSQHLYFPLAGSGGGDDILVAYAHESTTMDVTIVSNTGYVTNTTKTFEGLLAFNPTSTTGYSLEISSDKPIAAMVADELPQHPHIYSGSGYYFGGAGQSELYDHYMQIRQAYGKYETFYTPSAAQLGFANAAGTPVGVAQPYAAKTGLFLRDAEVGFSETEPLPYVVRLLGDVAFANRNARPAETDIRASAGFMGWNTSLATIEVHTEQANIVRIYDGRTLDLLTTVNLAANEVWVQGAVDAGFPPDQPFLARIVADEPIYQEIQNSRYLRQYPGELGPTVE